MDLIEQFVARFRKEYDFYDHAARLAAQLIEQSLQNAGIRAIVTSRAKSPSRLEQKLRQRHLMKHYQSIDDIFKDIVDLAGVRVALYFPAERDQVGKIIVGLFTVDGKISDSKFSIHNRWHRLTTSDASGIISCMELVCRLEAQLRI